MPKTPAIPCVLAVAAGALLAACASTPQALRGDFYTPISPTEAALEQRTGAYVRWGGQIVSVSHTKHHTCFNVLGRPLDSRAKPEQSDAVDGRYRACAPGFYDPEVYEKGRSITTTGVIAREATQRFESFDLRVPEVAADVVYLWPRRAYYAPYPAYPFFGYGWGGPYGYGGYGYGYPYGWGPYWGGPWIGAGWGAPYYGYGSGYGYRYRYPYRYGYRGGGGRGRAPHRAARMVRGGSRGNVGSGGGQRVPVRRR